MIDLCLNIDTKISNVTSACKPTTFDAKLNNYRGMKSVNLDYNIKNFWTSPVPEHCQKLDNHIFVQYTCEHDEETKFQRYAAVCFIGSMAVFLALLFAVWVRYADNDTNI